MISYEIFQAFLWTFIIMGWIGAGIISVASIFEVIKMIRGVE